MEISIPGAGRFHFPGSEFFLPGSRVKKIPVPRPYKRI
jgi:hypothetical protein